MLVLETLEDARQRAASVLCELLGFGCTADGTHICIPSAAGQTAAMVAALRDAGLDANAIDYVNAHGTGTRIGDLSETQAIRAAFGSHADSLAVSSTKAAHGHLLGAAGALELVASIMAARGGFLPPTLNLREPDPECDLDYVAETSRSGVSVHTFMTNSFAFGGSNGVLIAGVLR